METQTLEKIPTVLRFELKEGHQLYDPRLHATPIRKGKVITIADTPENAARIALFRGEGQIKECGDTTVVLHLRDLEAEISAEFRKEQPDMARIAALVAEQQAKEVAELGEPDAELGLDLPTQTPDGQTVTHDEASKAAAQAEAKAKDAEGSKAKK